MVVSLASQGPRSRRFCACGVLGWSNGRLGFGDSEILECFNAAVLAGLLAVCSKTRRTRRGPQTLASPNDLQELVRAGLGAASKQT
jgi:hypothetical protein